MSGDPGKSLWTLEQRKGRDDLTDDARVVEESKGGSGVAAEPVKKGISGQVRIYSESGTEPKVLAVPGAWERLA